MEIFNTFNLSSLASLLVVLLYFLLSIGLYYFPLRSFFKNKELTWKLIIPVSLSIQVIFAYIFYSLSVTHLYPLIYFVSLTAVNLFFLPRIWKALKAAGPKKKSSKPLTSVIITSLLVFSVIFSRLFDAIKFNAPGNPDALAHLIMLRELVSFGHFSNAYYAPGFHLILLPLTYLIPSWDILRFGGPVIGIVFLATIYFLFRNIFKNKSSAYFLILLFCLPIFSRLGLQTIGFFSSSISFIILPLVLFLISAPRELSLKNNAYLLLIATIAISLTIPYLLVPIIPMIALLWLIAVVVRYKDANFKKHLGTSLMILVIGFIVSFGHVYLHTRVVKHTAGFPQIPTIQLSEDKPTIGNNYSVGGIANMIDGFDSKLWVLQPLVKVIKSDFYKSMVRPMVNTGIETLSFKNLLGFDNLLTAGGWLYLLVLGSLLYWSIKKQNNLLLTITLVGLIFGLSTQTGFLEMSFYRGRSGWYYNILMILTAAYIFDALLLRYSKILRYLNPLLILMAIVIFIKPLVFPHLFYAEEYAFADNIARESKEKILLIGDEPSVGLVDENIIVAKGLDSDFLDEPGFSQKYIIFPSKPVPRGELLSGMIFSAQKDVYLSDKEKYDAETLKVLEANNLIKLSPEFMSYRLFAKTDNIEIYQWQK